MSKPTAGPWTMVDRSKHGGGYRVRGGTGRYVASTVDNLAGGDEQEANAARIVACVNALEGIEDPEAFMAAVRPLIGNAAGLSMLIDTDDPAAELALIGEQGMDLYRMINPRQTTSRAVGRTRRDR